MKEPQLQNITIAFVLGLVIIYFFSRLIGEENKGRWFKKRSQTGIFNRRGLLGEAWHFGYPRTWQGALAVIVMYALIFSSGYYIVFVL